MACSEVLAQDDLGQALLPFQGAIRYALDHAPAITSAKSTITEAEAQKLAAVSTFLPNLTVTGQPESFTPVKPNGSSVIGGVVIPNGHGYIANVASANLSLNLFSGGRDIANYRAGVMGLSSASSGMTAALAATLDQLLTDFGAVCVDQITFNDQERVVRIEADLIELSTLRMHGKMDSEIDRTQVQLQALQAQTLLSQARQQRTADLEKLFVDMGFAHGTSHLTLLEWIPEAPIGTSDDVPIEEDPAVSSAHDVVLAAQEKVEAARAGYYPTLAITAQYNYLGVDSSSIRRAFNATRANNYAVGLTVTIPVLPFFNVTADVDSARAAVLNAQATYQGVLVTASNRVTDAAAKASEAQITLDIASRSVELAHRNLRLVQDNYAARLADQRDVDTAKVSAAQAEQSFAIAQINSRLAGWRQYRAQHPKEFPATLLAAMADAPAVSRR